MQFLETQFQGSTYRLSVKSKGTARTIIVFLHGWGCAKDCFEDAFKSDLFDKYTLLAVDLLGYGYSDKPGSFSYDLADQAKVVATAVQLLKPEKVYILGHSMGGGVGLLCASELGGLVGGFISVEGNLVPQDASSITRQYATQPFWLFRSLTFPIAVVAARLQLSRDMRLFAKWLQRASSLAFYKSAQSLVVWSDNGQLLPLFRSLTNKAYIYSENGRRKTYILPELDVHVAHEISGSGHFIMLDNPEEFYSTVANIIQEFEEPVPRV